MLICVHDVEWKRKPVMVRSMISLNIVNTFIYFVQLLQMCSKGSSLPVLQLQFSFSWILQELNWFKCRVNVPLTCSGVHYLVVTVGCTLSFCCIEFWQSSLSYFGLFASLWSKPLHFRSWLCFHLWVQTFLMTPFQALL